MTFRDITSSIRKRLLFSFIGLLVLTLVPTLLLLFISFTIQTRYRQTVENITLEYEITETFDMFVTSYNQRIQAVDDQALAAEHETNSRKLDEIFGKLEKTVTFGASRALLKKLEGTTDFVQEYMGRGFDEIRRGDFSQSSENIEQINRGKTST